jgi:hypothetical protein
MAPSEAAASITKSATFCGCEALRPDFIAPEWSGIAVSSSADTIRDTTKRLSFQSPIFNR